MAIAGISKLTKEQRDVMFAVIELHKTCVGNEYKAGIEIVKVLWANDKGIICVRLLNGDCITILAITNMVLERSVLNEFYD